MFAWFSVNYYDVCTIAKRKHITIGHSCANICSSSERDVVREGYRGKDLFNHPPKQDMGPGCLVRGGKMPQCCGGGGLRHIFFSDLKNVVTKFPYLGRGIIIININDWPLSSQAPPQKKTQKKQTNHTHKKGKSWGGGGRQLLPSMNKVIVHTCSYAHGM